MPPRPPRRFARTVTSDGAFSGCTKSKNKGARVFLPVPPYIPIRPRTSHFTRRRASPEPSDARSRGAAGFARDRVDRLDVSK